MFWYIVVSRLIQYDFRVQCGLDTRLSNLHKRFSLGIESCCLLPVIGDHLLYDAKPKAIGNPPVKMW